MVSCLDQEDATVPKSPSESFRSKLGLEWDAVRAGKEGVGLGKDFPISLGPGIVGTSRVALIGRSEVVGVDSGRIGVS